MQRIREFFPFLSFIAPRLLLFGLLILAPSLIQSQDQIPDPPQEIKMEHRVEATGHALHYALPATAALTTLIIGDKEGSWQFLKSFGANMAVTYTLKYAFDKPRPEGATDGLAFPSGHTSVAFNSAAFIQKRYGWKYGIPAYLLAAFVGYSRIEGLNDRHDGWDVLGGIITGVGTAYLFTSPFQSDELKVSLTASDGQYSIGVVYRF